MVWSSGEGRKRGLGGKCKAARPRGKLRETWLEVVKNDMKDLGLASADVLGWHFWRRKIVETHVTR